MTKTNSKFGYDLDGKPCDYVDETGMVWVYVGKRNGIDRLERAPDSDKLKIEKIM